MNFDPYTVLELAKNCTDDEIKSAFKAASLKYHPDRGGDPVKFDQCRKAKELLLNKQHRHIYSCGGWEAVNHYIMVNTAQPKKCSNFIISLDVTLEDVYNRKTIPIKNKMPNGEEFILSLDLRSEMLMHDICVKNAGLSDKDSLNGDVIIKINLINTDFKVQGEDLILELKIPFFDLLEFTINIDHPSGHKYQIKTMFKNPDANGNMLMYYPQLGMSQKGSMIICAKPDYSCLRQLNPLEITNIRELTKDKLKFNHPRDDSRKDITDLFKSTNIRQERHFHQSQQSVPCNMQ